jgi:hypothetical protein
MNSYKPSKPHTEMPNVSLVDAYRKVYKLKDEYEKAREIKISEKSKRNDNKQQQ